MGRIIVGGIIEKNGKFLLVQETKEICKGKWNIPAGRLEPNETVLDGAKREIKEETGCDVELTGIITIGNRTLKDKEFLSIIFSTKLIKENIKYNKNEILNVKWFTYDEILNMKDSLRSCNLIIAVINSYINKEITDINLIKIM